MMMNLIKTPVITFTKDYLVSCGITRLRPEELLKDFIIHVNYDAYMNGSEHAHTRHASKIINAYNNNHQDPFDITAEHRTAYLQCFKSLTRIQHDKLITPAQRRLRTRFNVKVWAGLIRKNIQFVDMVLLADGKKIELTPDFIVVCFMHGIDPESLLNHFINGITIIKAIAFGGDVKAEYNPFYHFFVDAADLYFKDSEELHQAGHSEYLEKLKKLQTKMRQEPVYEKRLAQLEALADKWCEALKEVAIEKVFKD